MARCNDVEIGWHRIFSFVTTSVSFKLSLKRDFVYGNTLNYDSNIVFVSTGSTNGNSINILNCTNPYHLDVNYRQAYKLRMVRSADRSKVYIDAYIGRPDGLTYGEAGYNNYWFKIYNPIISGNSEKAILDLFTGYDSASTDPSKTVVIVPEELETGEVLCLEHNLLANTNLSRGLTISTLFGDKYANPINIDQIDAPNGYIYRVINGNSFSGTFPSNPSSGNAILLIGFSSIDKNLEAPYNIRYGSQIAIAFGGSHIFRRNVTYNVTGAKWPEWTIIPNKDTILKQYFGYSIKYGPAGSIWPGSLCRYMNITTADYYHFTAFNSTLDYIIEFYYKWSTSRLEPVVKYITGEEYIESVAYDTETQYLDITFKEALYWRARLELYNEFNSDT